MPPQHVRKYFTYKRSYFRRQHLGTLDSDHVRALTLGREERRTTGIPQSFAFTTILSKFHVTSSVSPERTNRFKTGNPRLLVLILEL